MILMKKVLYQTKFSKDVLPLLTYKCFSNIINNANIQSEIAIIGVVTHVYVSYL